MRKLPAKSLSASSPLRLVSRLPLTWQQLAIKRSDQLFATCGGIMQIVYDHLDLMVERLH